MANTLSPVQSFNFQSSQTPLAPEYLGRAGGQVDELVSTAKQSATDQKARLQDYINHLRSLKGLARRAAASMVARGGSSQNPMAIYRNMQAMADQAGVPIEAEISKALQQSNNIENTLSSILANAAQIYTTIANVGGSLSQGGGISLGGRSGAGGSGRGFPSFMQPAGGGTMTDIHGNSIMSAPYTGDKAPFAVGGSSTDIKGNRIQGHLNPQTGQLVYIVVSGPDAGQVVSGPHGGAFRGSAPKQPTQQGPFDVTGGYQPQQAPGAAGELALSSGIEPTGFEWPGGFSPQMRVDPSSLIGAKSFGIDLDSMFSGEEMSFGQDPGLQQPEFNLQAEDQGEPWVTNYAGQRTQGWQPSPQFSGMGQAAPPKNIFEQTIAEPLTGFWEDFSKTYQYSPSF